MKKTLILWTLALIVLSVSLSACCGGGKETVIAAPASGVTAGQELQDLKAAQDQGAITDEEFEKAKERVLTRE